MDDDSSGRSSCAPQGAQPTPRRKATDIIEEFAARSPGDAVSVGDLLKSLDDRAFGMLFLILALPVVIPLPGLSTAVGAPLIVLGAQSAWGMRTPWLPARLARVSLPRATLLRVVAKAKPWLAPLENRARPRLPWFVDGAGERLAGAFVVVLAAVLSLPIVFGNFPPAAAIVVIALGLIEQDGLAVACGMVAGVLAVAFVALLVFGLGEAALYLAAQAFPALFSQAAPSCSPIC